MVVVVLMMMVMVVMVVVVGASAHREVTGCWRKCDLHSPLFAAIVAASAPATFVLALDAADRAHPLRRSVDAHGSRCGWEVEYAT